MENSIRLSAKACPLPFSNLNTDQILPARYLKWPRSKGLGTVLFQDLALRQPTETRRRIFRSTSLSGKALKSLLAGRNFGGGSSREAAVYALIRLRISLCASRRRSAISSHKTAVKNGLLTAVVSDADSRRDGGDGRLPIRGGQLRSIWTVRTIVCGDRTLRL